MRASSMPRPPRPRYLKVAGVSVHIGSQITDVAPFAEAVARVADLVRELRADGHSMEYVDIGGGLGIDYHETARSDFADCVARYARAVTDPLRGLNVHLLLEPGRAIVGPAGALVTSVVYRKENDGKRFLVVDAAMNDLIRPALYGAYHEIVPVFSPGIPDQRRSTGNCRCSGSDMRVGRLLRPRSRIASRRRGRLAGNSRCWGLRDGAGLELQYAPTASRSSGARKVG